MCHLHIHAVYVGRSFCFKVTSTRYDFTGCHLEAVMITLVTFFPAIQVSCYKRGILPGDIRGEVEIGCSNNAENNVFQTMTINTSNSMTTYSL